MHDYYQRMSAVYRLAILDRDLYRMVEGKPSLIAREQVMIPVVGKDSILGASILLSILAFPDEPINRLQFVNYVNAKLIKMSIPRNSPAWKNFPSQIAIPNKKIDQFLGVGKKSAGYRINMRMRAADALWMKLNSNSNPAEQEGLKSIAEKAASQNSPYFTAFTASPELGGDQADSFIKRIMALKTSDSCRYGILLRSTGIKSHG